MCDTVYASVCPGSYSVLAGVSRHCGGLCSDWSDLVRLWDNDDTRATPPCSQSLCEAELGFFHPLPVLSSPSLTHSAPSAFIHSLKPSLLYVHL